MTKKGGRKTGLRSDGTPAADRGTAAADSVEDVAVVEQANEGMDGSPSPLGVEQAATTSRTGQRLIAAEDIPSPEASLIDKVSGKLLQKFEVIFFQYQMDVSRTTTEAIREAMNTVRKDMKSLGERISDVESNRLNHKATAEIEQQQRLPDAHSVTSDIDETVAEEEHTSDEPQKHGRRRLFTPSTQGKPSYSDKEKSKFKTIRDWGLKFDGSSKSIPIERFLFRVETLQERHNISSDDLYASFHLLLEGAAQSGSGSIWRNTLKNRVTVFRICAQPSSTSIENPTVMRKYAKP